MKNFVMFSFLLVNLSFIQASEKVKGQEVEKVFNVATWRKKLQQAPRHNLHNLWADELALRARARALAQVVVEVEYEPARGLKLEPFLRENRDLKEKVEGLEQQIKDLERTLAAQKL